MKKRYVKVELKTIKNLDIPLALFLQVLFI